MSKYAVRSLGEPLGRGKCVWGRALRALVGCALVACVAASAQAQGLTAAWDANTDPYTVGYRLFGGTQPGSYTWTIDAGNTTSAALPTLTQPGTYYFVVRAYNSAGELGPPSNEVTHTIGSTTGPPGVPSGLTASSAGSRVTLTWGAPPGGTAPTNYLLYVGTASGASNIVSAYGVGNVLTASGDLGPGRYYARVQAANAFGASAISSEISFVVGGPDVPGSPAGLSVTWQGTVATLRWSAGSGAAAYILEAGSVSGASDIGRFNLGATTQYSVDVPPGTYYVRVRSANNVGESGPSNEITVRGVGAPSRPTALSATNSSSAVTLRWSGPTSGPAATGYVLEAGSAPGLANLAVIQLGAQTTYVAAAPPPGTYYVRVRAVNSRGASDASNEIIVRR